MIPAPATLAVLGGGQLGRFFVTAAHELGYRVIVLDPDENAPAGRIADEHLIKDYDDPVALTYIAQHAKAATTEFENVPAIALEQLAQNIDVYPSAAAVAIAQNRIAEKGFLRNNGFNTAPFAIINSADDFNNIDAALFPAILKTARFGYDGKGQAHVNNISEAKAAFNDNNNAPCVLETKVHLDLEVSLVMARNAHGEVECFTLAENQHRNGILDISITPARVSSTLRAEAEKTAHDLAEKLNYIGILTIEFFISEGALLINEIAPRPHNSGHYTLDACYCSQFEQQVRALCDLPLASSYQHSTAVMVNLLGDIWFSDNNNSPADPAWGKTLAAQNLKLHLYGKHEPRKGRKMGHFTIVDSDSERALKTALNTRKIIQTTA